MNGNTESALVEYARRSHENAEKASNAALRIEAAYEKTVRELSEIRRDMRHGFEALNSAILVQQPRIDANDWEDSPTGQHKRVPKRVFDQWARERELSADGRRWRKALNASGKIALALALVILGAVIRHFIGGLVK